MGTSLIHTYADFKNIPRTKAYDSGEYDKCVSNIETALKGYFKAKDDCEGLCYQMKAQMDRFPQFWRNIAEMEYGSVKCKNDCLDKIAAEGKEISIHISKC